MAKIELLDYIDVGSGSVHTATSWQIAKDPDFEKIIDESLNDTVNIKVWHSMLPMLPEDGTGYYADEEMIYARVKIHLGETVSPWYVLEPKDQREQDVTISKDGVDIETTTAKDLAWYN